MSLLIKNIKGLVGVEYQPKTMICGKEMSQTEIINEAFVFSEGGLISDFGRSGEQSQKISEYEKISDVIIDASGCFVFPSFCDPHTHLVYSGSREQEFVDRLRGLSYSEIAERGGGILNSAKKLHNTSADVLFFESMNRIREIMATGTGAVEIKSGYGLNTADELKMLRVIKRIRESCSLEIRATFLGAHAIPEEFKHDREKYIDLIIYEMTPLVASEELADYIDVFCDEGFFTVEETERILMAGIKHGLLPKLHANELADSGGIQTGVRYNAVSVDHLEHAGQKEIECLAGGETIPVLLPGSVMFLGLPRPKARKMIDYGLPVALASDYNPGSSPSGNMKLIMSLGCIELGMIPEESFNAATLNAAYAMGISETHGSIAKGKTANMFITKEMSSFYFFPYAFGNNYIDKVILKGELQQL